MKERPILFNAPMVRAILDGRKTQTRRIVKGCGLDWLNDGFTPEFVADYQNRLCPYGIPGDRLWVRETWQGPLIDEELEEEFRQSPDYFKKPSFCAYRATDTLDAINADGEELGWRPSIHMPRWASRILLEIVSVRVERFQDISDSGPQNDCTAEGVFHCGMAVPTYEEWHGDGFNSSEKWMYKKLWESINGAGSWVTNPWVWVVEFKRVTP